MSNGRFGIHGGQFIPETLMSAVAELEAAYEHYKKDPQFVAELKYLLEEYTGRPSRLYYAEKMTKDLGGARIYLKREDLNHTGSHKINNALGQVLLAKKMGKTRVIAETGAGQHGVATATAAALLGLECEVFMGKEDTDRQALNVYRMELLGAKVHPVTSGTQTLKDAVNETLRMGNHDVTRLHMVQASIVLKQFFRHGITAFTFLCIIQLPADRLLNTGPDPHLGVFYETSMLHDGQQVFRYGSHRECLSVDPDTFSHFHRDHVPALTVILDSITLNQQDSAVECIAEEYPGKAFGNDAADTVGGQDRCGLFPGGAAAKVASGHQDITRLYRGAKLRL